MATIGPLVMEANSVRIALFPGHQKFTGFIKLFIPM